MSYSIQQTPWSQGSTAPTWNLETSVPSLNFLSDQVLQFVSIGTAKWNGMPPIRKTCLIACFNEYTYITRTANSNKHFYLCFKKLMFGPFSIFIQNDRVAHIRQTNDRVTNTSMCNTTMTAIGLWLTQTHIFRVNGEPFQYILKRMRYELILNNKSYEVGLRLSERCWHWQPRKRPTRPQAVIMHIIIANS